MLGCSLDPRHADSFVNCVNNESANRANNARSEVERTLEKERAASKTLGEQNKTLKSQLDAAQKQAEQAKQAGAKAAEAARAEVRNSVNYAKSSAELAALQAGRALPFTAVYQCMEKNGAAARLTSDARAFAESGYRGAGHDDALLEHWSQGSCGIHPSSLWSSTCFASRPRRAERSTWWAA